MTAVAIVILVVGLLAIIGQSLLLVMLWGQQQRAEVRFEFLGRLLSAVSTTAQTPVPGEAARSVAASPLAPTIPPTVAEPAVSVPSQGNPANLTFPPPVRTQTPVPPASTVQAPRVAKRAAVSVSEPGMAASAATAAAGRAFIPAELPAPPRGGEQSTRGGSGLPAGSFLPDFELFTLDGERFRWSALPGKKSAIIFLSLDSPGSKPVIDTIRTALGRGRAMPDLYYVIDGGKSSLAVRKWLGKVPKRVTVLVQEETELATVLRVGGTPAAYLLDEASVSQGSLKSGPKGVLEALGIPQAQIPTAARRSSATTAHQLISQRTYRGLEVGTSIPSVTLPLLDGGTWQIDATPGRPRLVIFWDPDCPPCERMLDGLAEAAGGWSGFDAAIVTRGTAAENAALAARDLPIPVSMQQVREVARLFHVLETPAAVELSPNGTIARAPAIGAASIFQVAREMQTTHGVAQ